MIRAEILTIGRELLQGKTLNTNSKFLSEKLTQLGVQVAYHSSCDDDLAIIVKSLTLAFKRSDIVIVSGGLGPTPDDVTREAVADYFQTDLKFHAKQYNFILRYFKKLKRKPTVITKSEAYFPRIGKPILNQFGIALGFYVSYGKQLLVALPGVPRELEALYHHSVQNLITTKFKNQLPKLHSFSVSLIGLDESEMMLKLGKPFFKKYPFEFGSYPMAGWLILRFRSQDKKVIQFLRNTVSKRLKKYIYAWEGTPIETVIGQMLKKKKLTLAAAESCTGGLFSKRITDVAGSSDYFAGGAISYANQVKENVLSVSKESLKKNGAVSEDVARQMAIGAKQKFKTDIGVSITGIAGPTGGTREKPVGLVWIGIAGPKGVKTRKAQLSGERDRIRHSAVQRALVLLYHSL